MNLSVELTEHAGFVLIHLTNVCFSLVAAMEQALSIMCVAAQKEPKQVRHSREGGIYPCNLRRTSGGP